MALRDRINPVLLRELRRLSRNGFVITFINLFLFALLVAGVLLLGEARDCGANERVDGDVCLLAFFLVAGPIALFVIPALVFRRQSAQARRENSDLLFVATLRPSQIVDGMALSGFVLTLLLLSVTLPILVLSLLVSTIDLGHVFISIVHLAILSAGATYVAVACASIRHSAALRRLSHGLTLLPIFVAGLLSMMLLLNFSFADDECWYLALSACCAIAAGVLGRALAIGALAPASSNRYLPFHRALLAVWFFLTAAETLAVFFGDDNDFDEVMDLIRILALGVLLLVAAATPPLESESVWKRMKAPGPGRLFRHLFYSGGERGMALCLALTALTLLTSPFVRHRFGLDAYVDLSPSTEGFQAFLCATAGLMALPIVLARAIWRYGFAKAVPHPAGVVLGATAVLGTTLAFLSLAFSDVHAFDSPTKFYGVFVFLVSLLLFAPLFAEACSQPPSVRRE